MNKYGRATKMTTLPDKVKKNKDGTTTTTSGNTSVTMSDWIQPEKTPTPKNKISEEDYNASEAKRQEIIARNAAQYKPYNDSMAAYQKEQDDYKASMDQYKRASDFYNMGPEPLKEEAGNIKLTKGGKTRKGQQVTYEEGERYSAAKSNADLKKALKDNPNLVDINDKSINPVSRKIWMEQVGMDFSGTDLYGKQTGKRYVDKNEINKIKSNRDVYGEDFDMREWRKASEDPDPNAFGKYLDQKGYRGRTFAAKDGMGSYSEYAMPTAPKMTTSKMPVKPVIKEEKVPEKIKASDVNVSKLPTRKVLGIGMKPNLKYSDDVEVGKEGEWQPPVASRLKVEVDKSREGGQGGKWGLRNKISGDSGDKKLKPSLGISISGARNKREEKLAKAFYSPTSDLGHGGYYSSMQDSYEDADKAIRSDIKNIRQEKREWKSQTNLKGADKRSGAKEFREDIKTGRLSARYANRGGLYKVGNDQWAESKNSRLKTWTADIDKRGNEGAMSGYVTSAKQDIQRASDLRDSDIRNRSNAMVAGEKKNYTKQEQYIQSAEDNATNRNTLMAQMAKYKGWGSKIK